MISIQILFLTSQISKITVLSISLHSVSPNQTAFTWQLVEAQGTMWEATILGKYPVKIFFCILKLPKSGDFVNDCAVYRFILVCSHHCTRFSEAYDRNVEANHMIYHKDQCSPSPKNKQIFINCAKLN